VATQNTIFVMSATNVLNVADAVVRRVKNNDGNITINGVLAAFSSSLTARQHNWGGLRQKPVFVAEHIPIATVFRQGSDTPSASAERAETSSGRNLSFSTIEEGLTMERMLRLATGWGRGKYADYRALIPVCRFGGETFFENELVCVADLFNSMVTGQPLRNPDCRYDLMRPWLQSWNTQSPQFNTEYLKAVCMAFTGTEPASSQSNIPLFLDGWMMCKGCESRANGDDRMYIELLRNLGWV
jgi:hypothetical protein